MDKPQSEFEETFGSFVKDKRIKKGLTLREFCRRSDFSPSNWSRVERGIHQPTRKESYFQIVAETLGLNSAEIRTLQGFFPKPYAKRMDALQKELTEMRAKVLGLSEALEQHHRWQNNIGPVTLGGFEMDLSLEYSDSTMCEKTIKALRDFGINEGDG